MNYPWNWHVFWEASPDGRGSYLDTFWSGLGWTLSVALSAWMLALLLGVFVGVMRTLPHRAARGVSMAWVDLFRNIPLLVQVFLWYFVIPEFLPSEWGLAVKRMAPPWGAWIPAVLGLALFTSARVAEQVRAGIQALPKGQLMAATALGLTRYQAYRYVLLPMGMRIVLPPLTSEFMNTVKNSSVALTVGVLEVTAAARAMQEFSFQAFEAFTAATIIYVLINLLVVLIMRHIEWRFAVPGHTTSRSGSVH